MQPMKPPFGSRRWLPFHPAVVEHLPLAVTVARHIKSAAESPGQRLALACDCRQLLCVQYLKHG